MSGRAFVVAAGVLLSACASWNRAPEKLAIAPTREVREQAVADAQSQGTEDADVAANLQAVRDRCFDANSRTWKPTRECDALRIGSAG
jgi:hypothetical protein